MSPAIPKDRIRHILLYGSLRRGEANCAALGLAEALRFVRGVRFAGRMYDLGDYPAVVPGDGEVVGELFEVADAAVIERLDAFEAYRPGDSAPYDAAGDTGSLYLRKVIGCEGVTAFVYLYNGPAADLRTPVPSGDWVAHRRARG